MERLGSSPIRIGINTVAPDERLPFAQTAIMGVQHAVAMFGAT
ncbi:hypothetical protein ACUOA5_49435, partial [Escherichia coli]